MSAPPSPRRIDLNSDLGESFGPYTVGEDDGLFGLISSANVACGFHGGDPRVLERTVRRAAATGVGVGAHPGFLDLVGFGRREMNATPEEVRTDTLYQLGALDAFCRVAGVRMQHLKAHGALYNVAIRDAAIAGAVIEAVRSFNPNLVILAQPGTTMLAAAEEAGLPTAQEGFADRAYTADGNLVSRRLPGALITDPAAAAERMVRLVTEGKLRTIDGQELDMEIDSICVHSDTPGSLAIMTAIRRGLEAAGVEIAPLRRQASP